MTAVIVIEAAVIVLLLILVAGLLRSHAEILRQLHQLSTHGDGLETTRPRTPPATKLEMVPTAQISGTDPGGALRTVSLQHGRGNTLLAFLSSGCLSCQAFWEALKGDFDTPTPDTRVVVVTKGPASESVSRIGELAPQQVPLIMSDEVWDQFRVPATPYFLMVDGQGRILGEGSAASWRRLLRLFRRAVADAQHPAHLDTRSREEYTDSRLSGAGVESEDPTLYQNPVE